jgi:hypothetical protein
MKKLLVVLGVTFAFVVGLHFVNLRSSEVYAGQRNFDDHHHRQSGETFPLPSGQFSVTAQGSLAICFNPATLAEEPCSTAGALVVAESEIYSGAATVDEEGNSCVSFNLLASDLPVDARPPHLTANAHCVGKTLNYDSTTGTGDGSFTVYIGGTCSGATFDSTGATITKTGTFHFVVSNGGNRSDFIITALTDPAGGIGAFSFSGNYLRQ